MSKRATVGDMKAETNRGRSYIAIDDLGDLLRDHRAQMGSLQPRGTQILTAHGQSN